MNREEIEKAAREYYDKVVWHRDRVIDFAFTQVEKATADLLTQYNLELAIEREKRLEADRQAREQCVKIIQGVIDSNSTKALYGRIIQAIRATIKE